MNQAPSNPPSVFDPAASAARDAGKTLVGPDAGSIRNWADKLAVTEDQIRDAIQAVGPRASDVEEHLKGSRATTNAERMRAAPPAEAQ